MSDPARVLLVANRTAAGEELLSAVERRAEQGPARFHLLVPATPTGLHRLVDPEVTGRDTSAAQLERALPELSERAGSEVTGHVGDADALGAIQDALHQQHFDELLISTLPRRVSRWLHLDLVSKVKGLGLPVVHVESSEAAEAAVAAAARAA